MARPTSEARVLIAQRRTRVLAMRIEQFSYQQIAVQLGITEELARQDYKRAAAQAQAELAASAKEARELELMRLAAMEHEVWKVLRTRHIVIQQGKVVYLRDEPVEDDAPVLQAIDRLERISRRRAALLGLDAPVKVEVSAEVDEQIAAIAAALAGGVGDLEPPGEAEAPGDAEAG